MPDEQRQYEVVDVRSNVDRLLAIHHLLVDMVSRAAHAGGDWMRVVAPKGETLRLSRAVSVDGPHDDREIVTAAVGIPPIEEAEDRRAVASRVSPDFLSPIGGGGGPRDYPLFVDRGTGMFGSAHAPIHAHTGGVMRFESDGHVFFRRTVEGQHASGYVRDTFEQIRQVELPIAAQRLHADLIALSGAPTVVHA